MNIFIPGLVAACLSLVLMSTDIFFPSLASMAQEFHVSNGLMKATVWLNLLGSFVASLFCGSLSDHHGRRPLMVWGMLLFVLMSLLAASTSSLYVLLLARFLQGVAACVPFVVGIAIVQDLYSKKTAGKILGLIGAAMQIVPAAAPILGGYLDMVWGWRSSFILIAVLSVILAMLVYLFLPESHPPIHRRRVSFQSELALYKGLAQHREFAIIAILYPLLITGTWSYLAVAPFYFVETLKMTPEMFGYYIATMSIAYGVSSSLVAWTIHRWGLTPTLRVGLGFTVLAGVALMAVAVGAPTAPILIAGAVAIYCVGVSFVYAPSTAMALQQFPLSMGAAAALRNTLYCFFSTSGAYIGTFLSDASLVPMACVMLTIGILAAGLYGTQAWQRANKCKKA